MEPNGPTTSVVWGFRSTSFSRLWCCGRSESSTAGANSASASTLSATPKRCEGSITRTLTVRAPWWTRGSAATASAARVAELRGPDLKPVERRVLRRLAEAEIRHGMLESEDEQLRGTAAGWTVPFAAVDLSGSRRNAIRSATERRTEMSHRRAGARNAKSTAYLRTEPTDGTIHWRSVPSPIRSRILAWRHRPQCQSAPMKPESGVANGTDYSRLSQ